MIQLGPITTILLLMVPQLDLAAITSLNRDLRLMPRLAGVSAVPLHP